MLTPLTEMTKALLATRPGPRMSARQHSGGVAVPAVPLRARALARP